MRRGERFAAGQTGFDAKSGRQDPAGRNRGARLPKTEPVGLAVPFRCLPGSHGMIIGGAVAVSGLGL